MTNFEWLKEEINNTKTPEELQNILKPAPWCHVDCALTTGCKDCCSTWLKKEHETPMPELKTGMFVEYYDKRYDTSPFIYNARGYGVVVGDKIICQDGSGFYGLKDEDTINCITKIFNADSFNDCDDDTCIWERN